MRAGGAYNPRPCQSTPEVTMGRGPSIEARKNATDAKRGKIFTKIIREIGVAARAGGGEIGLDPGGSVVQDDGDLLGAGPQAEAAEGFGHLPHPAGQRRIRAAFPRAVVAIAQSDRLRPLDRRIL